MKDKIEIKRNRKSKLIALVVIVLLATVSFYVVLDVLADLDGFIKLKTKVLVILGALFTFALFFISKQLLSKKPALLIDSNGLTDYSSPSSVGLIPWQDITEIKESKDLLKRRLILVMVKNPEIYIQKKGAKLSSTRRSYYQTFGTPITLMPINFVYDVDKLINELKARIS